MIYVMVYYYIYTGIYIYSNYPIHDPMPIIGDFKNLLVNVGLFLRVRLPDCSHDPQKSPSGTITMALLAKSWPSAPFFSWQL